MNELDTLRQEAETLKNAIRVSTFHSVLRFVLYAPLHMALNENSDAVTFPYLTPVTLRWYIL